jgi:hypothetical protein
LALTFLTSGGRSVGTVRLGTEDTEFVYSHAVLAQMISDTYRLHIKHQGQFKSDILDVENCLREVDTHRANLKLSMFMWILVF